MKRTFLALATFTAITLLSCSSLENSTSAEDLNFSQNPALKKASQDIPIYEEQNTYAVQPPTPQATSSMTKTPTGNGTMSVSNVPYNGTTCSNEIAFDYSNIPHPNPKNVRYEFTCTSYSGAGTFRIDNYKLRCGGVTKTIPYSYFWPVTTTSFAGDQTNVICYLSFCGTCVGTAVGGGGCNYSMSGCSMINYYTY